MMKTRKAEQPLVMMRMEVMTRVIVVVITTTAIVDMMMTVAPILRATIAEITITRTVAMIGVNPLVIEKMKMKTYSMKNMMMMRTIMMMILKMMPKLTGGATLIVINIG